MMKAVIGYSGLITAGQDYEIISEDDYYFYVHCDNGKTKWILKGLFDNDEVCAREREKIRDKVAENVRNGNGWRIKKGEIHIQSNKYFPNEHLKVLEKLCEVLRVPDGEDVVTHAKVVRALADTLIGMQK